MARIRTVKPDLFRHDGLYDAEVEANLPVRIAFVGLFTVADKKGRFKWNPRRLKTEVLPYDDLEFSRVLDALWTRGFIQKYESDGQFFGVIVGFEKHQVINNREHDSELPDPAISTILTREARDEHASVTPLCNCKAERKGKEGKGKEGKGDMSRQSRDDANAHIEILEKLNLITGSKYKPVDSNLKLIKARIAEGHTQDEIVDVIAMQTEEWEGTKFEQYLRPATLFGAEKFNQYVGKLPAWRKEKRGGVDWLNDDDDVIEGEFDHG